LLTFELNKVEQVPVALGSLATQPTHKFEMAFLIREDGLLEYVHHSCGELPDDLAVLTLPDELVVVGAVAGCVADAQLDVVAHPN